MARESPDVALVGLGSSSEHALELISEIVREASCPVIAILHADDPAYIHEAAKRGVFAYIVDGSPDKLQSAIDITLQRFAEYQSLQGAFGRRAVIERAKGILMARHAISADAARASSVSLDSRSLGEHAGRGRRCEMPPRFQRPYPPEFRREAIRLVRATGRRHQDVARELGISSESLRLWIKQDQLDQGERDDGLTTSGREELRRLRKQVRELEAEREILKRAVTFFVRETDPR